MTDGTNQGERTARVFTVPAGEPFLTSLARAVLRGGFPAPETPTPEGLDLARWTILLPTRRARRAMAAAFLQAGGGGRLLPRIQAIGDPDEEELLWPLEGEEGGGPDLPPAISPLRRLFLLAGLIRDWAGTNPRGRLAQALAQSPSQTLALARSLSSLIDTCDTEGATLDGIGALLEGELAGHQQAALDFLDIVRVRLPEQLRAAGLVGPMERRNLLLAEERRRLETSDSPAPILAAGSTGSIPATADLLSTVARLRLGAVVLPGLDLGMDEESWESLGPQHPQYGMAELLKRMGIGRKEVRPLPGAAPDRVSAARFWFASETMRPVDTTDRWHRALSAERQKASQAVSGVALIEAPDQHAEAAAIALIMRGTLEEPGITCALVTPDRRLARRVKAELRRWRVGVDDTAGEPLIRTPAGSFTGLVADAAAAGFDALSLAGLLSHPLCRLGTGRGSLVKAARALEAAVLRSRRPFRGLQGLAEAVEAARSRDDPYVHPAARRIRAGDWEATLDLVARLLECFGPLRALFEEDEPMPLERLLEEHARTAEAAASGPEGASLWRGEESEVLSELISELLQEARHFPPLMPSDYPRLISDFLASAPVRPRFGRHPRLSILGLLEARLVEADVTILGGLNEGVWPAVAQSDPWLGRPQRRELGLPLPERRIGLAAHDFVQAFCRPHVTLTWSRKIGSEPTVPSRWVMRAKALLLAAGLEEAGCPDAPWLEWARLLDRPESEGMIGRPRVRPPVELRPKRLSVTRVEELMRDPYAAFARHILKLRPLDPLGGELGALERGQIIHQAIQTFTSKYPGPLRPDAADRLLDEARIAFEEFGVEDRTAAFWWPQMRRIAEWFLGVEEGFRADAVEQLVETVGELAIALPGSEFTLTARADRLDRRAEGTLRVMDYKTGALPSFDEAAKSYSPQLLLEAHMAERAAFKGLQAASASVLCYLRLSGGNPAGACRVLDGAALADAVRSARDGLLRLIEAYARPETGYEATDWSQDPKGERDFGHLSRWREWSIGTPEEEP